MTTIWSRLVVVIPTVWLWVGCAATAPREPAPVAPTTVTTDLQEQPVAEGSWRAHRLTGCQEDRDVSRTIERYLGLCSEYFRDGSGSDGMIELELGLKAGHRHSLLLMALGQLYLMAGQGEPTLLPVEGPAADVGNWERNRKRLLNRARALLQEAAPQRPDDAAVAYLLADVARAEGDFTAAAALVAEGQARCTGGRSFSLLQLYQQLNRYPARHRGGPPPIYPASAVRAGLQGPVVQDLLLSPAGVVRQVVTVSSPAPALTVAAAASLRQGEFEAARLGKYPVWAWLRVTTAFSLTSE